MVYTPPELVESTVKATFNLPETVSFNTKFEKLDLYERKLIRYGHGAATRKLDGMQEVTKER
jgi:hypothetical protein